jgi:hypothetical protein
MSFLDLVEAWFKSTRNLLEMAGVAATCSRSDDTRSKPSCALNLQRGHREADLVLWNTGEGELALVQSDGSVTQEHLEIQTIDALGMLLERMVNAVA